MGMLSLLACLLASTAPAAPAAAWTPDANDPRQRMLAALVEELDRSRKSLMLRGHEAPYFLSYEFDNTGSQEMFDFDGSDSGYSAGREAPLDEDPAALRNAIWLLTDESYKKSLSAYLKKKGKEVYRPDDPDRPPSFSRESASVEVGPALPHPFDREAWKREAREQTARLRAHPELFDSQLRVWADHELREFASTEGTRLVTEHVIYGLHVQAWARAGRARRGDGGRAARAPAGAGARSLHGARAARARGGGRPLPRGGRAPARGRATERRQGRPHLQGPGGKANIAFLSHHRRRSDGARHR